MLLRNVLHVFYILMSVYVRIHCEHAIFIKKNPSAEQGYTGLVSVIFILVGGWGWGGGGICVVGEVTVA